MKRTLTIKHLVKLLNAERLAFHSDTFKTVGVMRCSRCLTWYDSVETPPIRYESPMGMGVGDFHLCSKCKHDVEVLNLPLHTREGGCKRCGQRTTGSEIQLRDEWHPSGVPAFICLKCQNHLMAIHLQQKAENKSAN